MFGPIRLEVSEKMLIDRGILAKPYFKFIPIGPKQQPPTLRVGTSWQKAEEVGIVTNHYRNKCICAEVIRASRWGLTSMVLVKRQKHGKICTRCCSSMGCAAHTSSARATRRSGTMRCRSCATAATIM
jgi:hypothetical protein